MILSKACPCWAANPSNRRTSRKYCTWYRSLRKFIPAKPCGATPGYDFEKDILAGKLGPWETTKQLLDLIDILVDGEFHLEEKDLKLRFRGSSNQRVIDVKKSLASDEVVLWDDNDGLFEPDVK